MSNWNQIHLFLSQVIYQDYREHMGWGANVNRIFYKKHAGKDVFARR
jgi:hypothetical protein